MISAVQLSLIAIQYMLYFPLWQLQGSFAEKAEITFGISRFTYFSLPIKWASLVKTYSIYATQVISFKHYQVKM